MSALITVCDLAEWSDFQLSKRLSIFWIKHNALANIRHFSRKDGADDFPFFVIFLSLWRFSYSNQATREIRYILAG